MTHTPAASATEAVAPVVLGMARLIAPRKPSEVTAEHHLIGDLGFHSLVLAELGYNLEDLYGLRSLTPEEAMKLERAGDVVDFVVSEVAAGRATLPTDDEVELLLARYDIGGSTA
ncbi:acyl carrier protein [Streptomyces sp. NPDC006967]|uniref:acyl carrier protein n=1 Tax=Streptomyces TaxID=1883 RepID=UPI0015E19C2E|nr:acyl carrier protein [Streptomyces sp. SM1]